MNGWEKLGKQGLSGGRTRDRTLDLSRVKGTLSRRRLRRLTENRRITTAYAAVRFCLSYAIAPKNTPSGTRLGPERDHLSAPCGAPNPPSNSRTSADQPGNELVANPKS